MEIYTVDMRRRIVLHGPSTLTVSIPTAWAKKHGIKKGDEIEIQDKGSKLIVTPTASKTSATKKLQLKSAGRVSKSLISASYRQGYDSVNINYDDSHVLELVHDIAERELPGFEIVQQKEGECSVHDLGSVHLEEFDAIVRRIWLLLLDMIEASISMFNKPSEQKLRAIVLTDRSINKLSNYCIRLLTKKGHGEGRDSVYHYFIRRLEGLADQYKDMCAYMLYSDVKFEGQIEALYGLNEAARKLYALFYKFDVDETEQLFQKLSAYRSSFNSLREKCPVYFTVINRDLRELLSALVELRT